MTGFLRRLWSILRAPDVEGARFNPDGGPGPHSGPYPWEEPADGIPPAIPPGPRTVVGIDLAGPEPVAVFATEEPDGTIIIDNMADLADLGPCVCRSNQPGWCPYHGDGSTIVDEPPLPRPRPPIDPRPLDPGHPDYWGQVDDAHRFGVEH